MSATTAANKRLSEINDIINDHLDVAAEISLAKLSRLGRKSPVPRHHRHGHPSPTAASPTIAEQQQHQQHQLRRTSPAWPSGSPTATSRPSPPPNNATSPHYDGQFRRSHVSPTAPQHGQASVSQRHVAPPPLPSDDWARRSLIGVASTSSPDRTANSVPIPGGGHYAHNINQHQHQDQQHRHHHYHRSACLLYTSDAADE